MDKRKFLEKAIWKLGEGYFTGDVWRNRRPFGVFRIRARVEASGPADVRVHIRCLSYPMLDVELNTPSKEAAEEAILEYFDKIDRIDRLIPNAVYRQSTKAATDIIGAELNKIIAKNFWYRKEQIS